MSVVVQVFNPCIQKDRVDLCEFEESQDYTGSSGTAGLHKETLSQQEEKQKEKRKGKERKKLHR